MMFQLMQKLNLAAQNTEAHHGLTLGLSKGLFKQVGAPDHKVIPKLNASYVMIHNMSLLHKTQHSQVKMGHVSAGQQRTGDGGKVLGLDSSDQTKDDLFGSGVDLV